MNAIPTLTPLAMPCNSSFEAKDWEILSTHWYPVARIQDVSNAPQRVTLLDVNMALYKTESGEIHLVRDICPHRGVPLTKGWVDGEELCVLIMVYAITLKGNVLKYQLSPN